MSAQHDELKSAIAALQQWIGNTDAAVREPTSDAVKAVQAAGMNAGQTLVKISPAARRVLAGILHDIHENANDIPEEAFNEV